MDAEEQLVQQAIDQAIAIDTVKKQAAATPHPGPVRDAFALQPNIQVNRYTVRPFYDYDFELLQTLNHSLYKLMTSGGNQEEIKPRGPEAWQLVWIMTRPVKEVRNTFRSGGAKSVSDLAEEEFSELNINALSELMAACVTQMTIYWSPGLAYDTPTKEGEGVAKVQTPFSQPTSAALGGS